MFIDFEPYNDGWETFYATPEQYGFIPKTLEKKSGVNHSENAAIGFSVVIPKSVEDSYATMDLSKFAGKTINVRLYLKSESQGTVTLGILENEREDVVTTQLDSEWTQVTFSYQFNEKQGEKALFFQGDGTDDFYIDDISITMTEAGNRYETQVLKDSETPEEPISSEAGKETSDVTPQASPSSDVHNSPYPIIIVVCIIIALVGLIAYIVRKKAGKK